MLVSAVIGLGVVESREDDELRAERQKASNYKYAKSWLALALPVAYCLLDAAGTFADTLVLDTLAGEAEAQDCLQQQRSALPMQLLYPTVLMN